MQHSSCYWAVIWSYQSISETKEIDPASPFNSFDQFIQLVWHPSRSTNQSISRAIVLLLKRTKRCRSEQPCSPNVAMVFVVAVIWVIYRNCNSFYCIYIGYIVAADSTLGRFNFSVLMKTCYATQSILISR